MQEYSEVDSVSSGFSSNVVGKTSILECLRNHLRKKTENILKMSLSDHDAFSWKLRREKMPLLDTIQLINVNRTMKDCEQVELGQLQEISFPVLSYTTTQLTELAIKILESVPYVHEKIGIDLLKGLVVEISKHYNIVAYHNFSHAFSLTLMLFQSVTRSSTLRGMLRESDIFVAYLAGLVHDFNHPGTNNAFEVKLQSKLAALANNQAVLQKFHLNEFWKLLRQQHQLDCFQKMDDPTRAKELVTKLVLATDMGVHAANLQKLQTTRQGTKTVANNEHIDFLLTQLFHGCDIGNPCIDFTNYMNWAALLSFQFDTQARLQKERGLQVSDFLRFKSLKSFYQGQQGFSRGLVLPLWKELKMVWCELEEFVANIEENLRQLEEEVVKQDEKENQQVS